MEDDSIVLDAPIHEKDRIGGGAYGAVYKVKLNGTSCIAKRLHDILTGSRGEEAVPEGQWRVLLDKFNQECAHLKRMKHPNIVQFLGVYKPGDNPSDIALVMERLHMDLASLVNSYGRLLSPKPNDTFISLKLHILMDVSCGLAHMHSHGLVHRDLNDGNVLLTETLQAKIADLGMARIIIDDPIVKRSSGRLTVAPGAQDFMPPEALQENPIYGDKLDIFSLGHLMLFLMTCIYPRPEISRKYQRTNWMSVEALKRRNSLDHIRSHILYDLIVRCLEDDPKDRPSIMMVKDELKRHCRGHQKTLEMVLTLLDKRRVSYKDETKQIKESLEEEKLILTMHTSQ
jgi:serine/threonine protein kinase